MVNTGKPIGPASQDICAVVTPDRKYLMLNSFRSGYADNYWVDARVIDQPKHRPQE